MACLLCRPNGRGWVYTVKGGRSLLHSLGVACLQDVRQFKVLFLAWMCMVRRAGDLPMSTKLCFSNWHGSPTLHLSVSGLFSALPGF